MQSHHSQDQASTRRPMRERVQEWRERKSAEGYRQVAIWIPDDLRVWLDTCVERGDYANRSEAVASAIDLIRAVKEHQEKGTPKTT
ncbi:Protein of unknown function (DUF3018) [Breoghania corrubedonensis]|uniref:Arc/MetJ-type ribon-helix-helix transcriptional regulator n=1 Tax=Breoghania corrubedonensis TaxID=665038 RepID=A0A2T5UPX9_9HYPH|nr:Protein of unknown function (DUF3018) [Breoghania corrubedonensis]